MRRLLALAALVGACAAAAPRAAVPTEHLLGHDGREHALLDPQASLTVIEFFSEHCKCQTAHDARLRALANVYQARGVRFVAIDSELGADARRDQRAARAREYPFPILLDPGGSLARKLGARYATYTLLVDRGGTVLYAGGIDSDVSHLTSTATLYLRDALDDALAGRPVRRAHAETLGCALSLD